MPLPTRIVLSVSRGILAIGMVVIGGAVSERASAQISYTPYPNNSTFQSGVSTGAPVEIPQTNLTPVNPPATTYTPPANSYGSFDPYTSTPPASGAPIPGVTTNLGPGVTVVGPPSTNSAPFGLFSGSTTPSMSAAGYGYQSMPPVNNPSVYGTPPFESSSTAGVYGAPPTFPSTVYPQSVPSSLFPEGFGSINSGSFLGASTQYSAFRLLQGPRFRYTFVTPGKDPDDLGINDFDFAVAFAFPRFLHSSQPFYVVPSFSLHLWDGPKGSTGADLPANAYSAFLDLGWESDPNQLVGTELGLRLGAYTDFDTYNSDSFRVMGKGLVNFRLTPTSMIKVGAYYADRNEIKIVPAAGVFCRPDPFTRIDLYFPQPRYARYCRTIGVYDLWWYLTGELGGGNWTIKRSSGVEDSVDINDLRVILGWEWGQSQAIQNGRRVGFAEVGYVFDREIRYRYYPKDINLDDAFMFRIGIGY